MNKMKAVMCLAYGGPEVLQVQHIDKPSPTESQLLIKVMAASITTADSMMRKGEPKFGRLFLGLNKPKYAVSGTGFSGIIESVGKNVKDYKIGDHIFGESIFGNGSQAEYLCIDQGALFEIKPETISHAQAASICDGVLTSYSFLKDLGQLKAGQHILINGAAGSLGSAAIEIAKHLGATVTATCSDENREFVSALGADFIIHYRDLEGENFQPAEQYNLIYDAVGKLNYKHCRQLLVKDGQYLTPVLSLSVLGTLLFSELPREFFNKLVNKLPIRVSDKKFNTTSSNKKIIFSATGLRPENELRILLQQISKLISQKKITPVIQHDYTFDEIIQAHEYIDTGHKRANISLIIE